MLYHLANKLHFLDDGAFYFDEKVDQSPLSTTASVVRGLTALAAVTSENLKVIDSMSCRNNFP